MINDPQNIARLVLDTIRKDQEVSRWMADNQPGKELKRFLGEFPGELPTEEDCPFVSIPFQEGTLTHGRGSVHKVDVLIVLAEERLEEIDNGVKSHKGYRLISELAYLVFKAVAQASENGWRSDNACGYAITQSEQWPQWGAMLRINLTMMV